jgi:hypothetical protein
MIILTKASGQLGNTLWACSLLITYAQKHNIPVRILALHEKNYVDFFEEYPASTSNVKFHLTQFKYFEKKIYNLIFNFVLNKFSKDFLKKPANHPKKIDLTALNHSKSHECGKCYELNPAPTSDVKFQMTPFKCFEKRNLNLIFNFLINKSSKDFLRKLANRLKIFGLYFFYGSPSQEWVSLMKNKVGLVFLSNEFKSSNIYAYENNIIEIKKLFKVKQKLVQRSQDLVSECKKNFEFTVGVHIRRGDYRTWRKGAYFFEDDVYNKQMANIEKQLKQQRGAKSVCFIICSNEKIELKNFYPLNIQTLPSSPSMIEDLEILSLVDFIIGPPSTFSMWASYVGHVPIHFILDKNETVEIKEFSPIIGFNLHKNGKTLTLPQ